MVIDLNFIYCFIILIVLKYFIFIICIMAFLKNIFLIFLLNKIKFKTQKSKVEMNFKTLIEWPN